MHEYRQALMRLRQGDSEREIAPSDLMGPPRRPASGAPDRWRRRESHTVTRSSRPCVVVTPGEGVVTDAQKAQISALRVEWVALHNSIKQRPLTDAAAWMKINAKAGVTSCHLIPL